jgi:hypothetical protein
MRAATNDRDCSRSTRRRSISRLARYSTSIESETTVLCERFLTAFSAAALATVPLLPMSFASAQVPLPTAESKACKALPTAAVEAALGSRVASKTGSDLAQSSSCTVAAGAANAKVEIRKAGQPGLPTDAASALEAVKRLLGDRMQDFESEVIGNVGCYRGTLEVKGFGTSYATACVLPSGYITVAVTRSDELAEFAAVKAVVDKLASATP